MQQIVRQLQSVQDKARWLLIVQRIGQAVAVSLGCFLALVLIDYFLILPGAGRLVIALTLICLGGYWLAKRLNAAAKVRPSITELALYAERLHPELAGRLATGVDFHLHPERYSSPELTGALRDVSVNQMAPAIANTKLADLIDLKPTLKRVGIAALVIAITAGLAAASPAYALVAFKRWALPWAQTPWPSQHMLESAMGDVKVWPSDQPVKLRATVNGPVGESPLRVRAYYRWSVDGQPQTDWQSVLMNRAAAGSDRVDPYESLLLPPSGLSDANHVTLDFSFELSEQSSSSQSLALVARPRVIRSTIQTDPPAYAAGIVAPSTVNVDPAGSGLGAASGLVGSQITMTFAFNKPIAISQQNLAEVFPGLAGITGLQFSDGIQNDNRNPASGKHEPGKQTSAVTLTFQLGQSVETQVKLRDQYGLESQSEQIWRVDAIVDQLPSVSMIKPAGDESVLATALVPLQADGQDDVAVETIQIQMVKQTAQQAQAAAAATTQPAAQSGGQDPASSSASAPGQNATQPQANAQPEGEMIASNAGRAGRLTVSLDFDLKPLALKPGDSLVLFAVATDNYLMDAVRHPPVKSAARTLRIIDEQTLITQLRNDLTALRQAAARTEQTQAEAQSAREARQAQPTQDDVARRLQAHQQMLRQVEARVAQNRLTDPSTQQTLAQVDQAMQAAIKAQEDAQKSLSKSANDQAQEKTELAKAGLEQARQEQAQVRKALTDMMNAIDQGKDTLAIQAQIQQMIKELQNASAKTQELLPKTMGKSTEQLAEDQKAQIQNLTQKQDELSRQAQALSRQMQTAAQELSRQESAESQSAAQSLTEAAKTAREENLDKSLQQGAESASKNRLSEAAAQQKQAQKTLEKMLEKLQEQDQVRRELLERKLIELAEKVRRLIEAQTALNQTTLEAKELAAVDPQQSQLRAQTLQVTTEARANPLAAKAVGFLSAAVERQADAINAIRAGKRQDATTAQQQALAQLQAALAELEKQSKPKDEQDDEREKLKAAYLALAKEQEGLIKQATPLSGKATLTRKDRATAFELAKEQEALRTKAGQLGVQVQQTLTFKAIHKAIDRSAIAALSGLKLGPADPAIVIHQADVQEGLLAMADALEESQRKDDFDENNPDAGGGGGGGSGKPPLVPPVAELKLLRQMQKSLIRQTQAAQAAIERARETKDPTAQSTHTSRALELSVQQRELSNIGEELINKLSQGQGQPGGQGQGQ